MKNRKHNKSYSIWLFALGMFLLAGFSVPSFGQSQTSPKAGSVIGNQATSTYIDASGVERMVTSNLVTTTIQQVGAVSIETDQSRYAAPGGQVYYPHIITNNGNGDDSFTLQTAEAGDFTFSQVYIYADENGDGVPDNLDPILTTPNLAAGENYRVVVAGYVPTTVNAGDQHTLTITATSTFNTSVSDPVTDTTIISNNAVVNVIKSLDSNSGAAGDPITVTLTYTNTGNSDAASLLLKDVLPQGMQYVAGSARWSVTGQGIQLTDADQVAQGTAPQTIVYDYDETAPGMVTATISQISPGQTGNLTFRVLASGDAGIVENTATFSYNDGTGAVPEQSTNTVQYRITESAAVSGSGSTIASASQGSYVDFNNIVTNNGNATDVFDVTLEGSTFPAGTSFILLKEQGAGTLLDTDGDGIPDTGPLAAGASYTVVLRTTLPSDATGGPYEVQKRITSSIDESVSTTLTDQLTSITASTVDLTNDAPASDPAAKGEGAYVPGQAPLNSPHVLPGESTTFTLYVTNTSSVSDNYDLKASTTEDFSSITLPAGWTVTFKDQQGGVVTNTGNITAGSSRLIYAEVFVPEGQAASATGQSIYFMSQSAATGASDRKHDEVIVHTVRSLKITPNNSGQAYPGGVVVYQHTLTNEGNITESNIALSLADSYTGFTSIVYEDANRDGILDSGDPVISNIASLAPNESKDLLVKVSAPGSAGIGINNTTTVTASVDPALVNDVAAPADAKASDVTFIITSNVTLVKQQSLTQAGSYQEANLDAEPGDIIYYKLKIQNQGIDEVSNISLEDVTPVYTTYVGSSASVTQGTVTDEPVAGSPGVVKVSIGTLAAGASAELIFAVQIDS
ncbi:MAG: hypothetical protein MK198_03575 [Gracilimonas sp.]|uniref:hypothetical protein n=1 Tax=Gracilimonas sp. TaxID=1974203 RepID=UPI0037530015|nr:hypothetical protein [Gracilimonas sp.]